MKKLVEGAGKLGIKLNSGQVKQFELYYQELIEWNKKINLTAITDCSSVQVKHFLDSLTIALVLHEGEVARPDFSIVDIGTGAGFPGVPLKILFPQPRLVLIEPTTKKTAFLHHIIRKLELENVEVLNSGAEEAAHLPLYREQFTLVLSRAVALLPTLVELTLPFCRLGGRFIAQKKGEIAQEIDKAEKAIATLGGKLSQIEKIELDEFDDARYLVIIDKICFTPGKYPRRTGVPRRRPL
ncbi:MAG: 16S rRNA (guanine(527)-N(7))-methyltransferase [Chloroflexi bacterium RBG_13_51_36]|nr:MAG: 16S rRNA (guanine(527)-N(7))-methyltransferase [Chloroflexi bacterium RBG_13_51_36]